MQTRRDFIKSAALASAGLALLRGTAWPYSQSPLGLKKFIQPLPGLGPNGIPVATPKSLGGADYYEIEVGEYSWQFHPSLPKTKLWGYADTAFGLVSGKPNHGYLGGVIVARKDRPVWLKVKNNLPAKHPLPVDTTLMGADGAQNRVSVHLHGGFVPWNSDGNPFAWFDPKGNHGPSFANGTGVPGEALYYYPNQQSARLMWYHDHAVGITRLNAYAGIATAYLIADAHEQALIDAGLIPSNQIPLIIQDKTFVTQAAIDDGYKWGKVGDLWYPWKYEPNSQLPEGSGRWDYGPDVDPPAVLAPNRRKLPVPSVVPEFFSDTALVNGAAYPYVEVQPRHYRFRILNGSQARFYNLQLYYEDSLHPGEADLSKPGPKFVQIGTEGGFLPAPVALNNPPQPIGFDPVTGNAIKYTLLLAPAERADIIIDFSSVPVGARLILYSDAPAPFPEGDPRNDYYTGGPDYTILAGNPDGLLGGAPSTKPGDGPNTRTLMQFRVVPLVGPKDPPSMDIFAALAVNASPTAVDAVVSAQSLSSSIIPNLDPKTVVTVRDLTLNEDFDEYGRLIQRLGTNVSPANNNQGLPTWGRNYMDAPTETPKAGDVEIWRIWNLTGDTHPIHFHLVNVQVLSRQPFDPDYFMANNGAVQYTGPARLPDKNERGYKETVRMNPGEVTTVIMKFDLPKVPFEVPKSPRTGDYEYVWHCHILEHEEHDMMRPLVVRP